MFLDMSFYRQKILVDEICRLLIFVRLGIQPSTSSSRGCRAEVEQNRPILLFCHRKRLINILAPIDCHRNPYV